jgi:hypothetical protein
MDCLLALRQGCKEEDEAEKFNSFLRKIAQNKEFFLLVRESKCSLIT